MTMGKSFADAFEKIDLSIATREEALLNAVGDVINDRVKRMQIPTPKVIVNVDMTPVAKAIAEALEKLDLSIVTMAKAFADLRADLAKQPPFEFKPTLNLPETQVHVQPPNVTVEAPKVTVEVPKTERIKRILKIKHDDGTQSTVSEE